jgi:hypothetical protein
MTWLVKSVNLNAVWYCGGPEVKGNHSFYVSTCLVMRKNMFYFGGITIIVAAPAADKKLENSAFQQQLLHFSRSIYKLKEKKKSAQRYKHGTKCTLT